MKTEQDSLERRLWARMEKVKADHEAKTKPEREVARITRKPITQEKLNVSLIEFAEADLRHGTDN